MAEEKDVIENVDEVDAQGAESAAENAVESVAEGAAEAAEASESPSPEAAADAEEAIAGLDDIEAQLKALEDAENAIDRAYKTGKADRAKITQSAQLDAAEAVAMAGIAMEADEQADEAMRVTVIAEKSGDREKIKAARKREREIRKKANADHKAATASAKKAYDAIKFSAPNKMGFMRAVQVVFAIHIALVLVFLMLTSRDAMVYDVTTLMDWIMAILEGVAFWMFINRYKIAKPFVIAMSVFGLIVPAISGFVTGHFNPISYLVNGSFYIFLIFYFMLSKRVDATLVNNFSEHKGDYEKEDFKIDRHGWPFYRNLIMYFILFSIIGHWMEMGMCQFIIMGLVQGEYDPSNTMLWRDWLYPFPMEGAAVVVIGLVLYPFYLWLKKKLSSRILVYLISFISGALLCTIIEFSMGMIVNADLQLWDYTDNFGNFMGQVCLQNTMAFGVVASIITWWVYPLLERWIARVPRDIMNIVFIVVAVFGAIVWSLYLINPPGVDEQNKHPEQAEQILAAQVADERKDEMEAYASSIGSQIEYTQLLRDTLQGSTNFTDEEKAKITAELDTTLKELKDLQAELKDMASAAEASAAAVASSGAAAVSSAAASATASSGAASSASAAAA